MSSASELSNPEPVYSIVVAEDAYLIREGIRSALEREKEEVEVLEYCPDLDSLLRAVEEHAPNVVITDIRMPPTNTDEGIQAATALRDSNPEIGVVVISQYVSPHYALKLFEHGSAGRAYLLKEHVGHRIQLLEAIREVAAGGSVVDPKVVDVLVEARMRAKNWRVLPPAPRMPRSPSRSSSPSAPSRRTSTRCSRSSISRTTSRRVGASGRRCCSSPTRTWSREPSTDRCRCTRPAVTCLLPGGS